MKLFIFTILLIQAPLAMAGHLDDIDFAGQQGAVCGQAGEKYSFMTWASRELFILSGSAEYVINITDAKRIDNMIYLIGNSALENFEVTVSENKPESLWEIIIENKTTNSSLFLSSAYCH